MGNRAIRNISELEFIEWLILRYWKVGCYTHTAQAAITTSEAYNWWRVRSGAELYGKKNHLNT